MSERSGKFYGGLILALFGYTTMIFAAATGVDSTMIVWTTQLAVILFLLGVAIMLLTA
ncbi:MAG: hypothetical protein ABSD41_01170 [Candidatus Bathyarchaeia archaeon]|jgi:hypothetical protein|nr:hypothetical protein [Candidatus Bathyarchaeia archaeon]HKM79264.1 hypothetical protein [Candidatus Bathyarchaeia archaeon]